MRFRKVVSDWSLANRIPNGLAAFCERKPQSLDSSERESYRQVHKRVYIDD